MSKPNDTRKKEYIDCVCKSMDHLLRVSYFDDPYDKHPDHLCLEMHLTSSRFFKRVWRAIKYVFGFKSRYGDFDEFLLDTKDAMLLKNMINKFLEVEGKKLIKPRRFGFSTIIGHITTKIKEIEKWKQEH